MDLPRPLRGLIVPMVTPLAAPDRLDLPALERLVCHILDGGVQGLFILGTTGEGPSLGSRMRRELIERVMCHAGTRVPVLVGVSDTSPVETLELANFAASRGASGLVLAAPYYYPLTQTDLARYVERLAPDLPLPFYLYNMPSHTKVAFEPATVQRLAELPNLYGLKDSSGNLDYFRRVCEALDDRPEFALLMGPEELLIRAMHLGADGGVCGGANLAPRLFLSLYEAARDGRQVDAERLQKTVLQIGSGVYTAGGNYLRGLKCALSVAGICSDIMAGPFEPLNGDAREQVQRSICELGLVCKK